MRKLATIRKVIDIQPIEGADFIEMITVDGWKLVSKKGEFKINDYCMYFEIDSLLPLEDTRFEFLNKNNVKDIEGKKYHRLKTIRLRGQISQGLALPITSFVDINPRWNSNEANIISDEDLEKDYSELLGVIKYEVPESGFSSGNAKGNFPSHIVPKTDEERVQNLFNKYSYNNLFNKFRWYVSEKLDGTSFTCLLNEEDEFIVCSRNLMIKTEREESKYVQIARKYGLEERLRKIKEVFGIRLSIQGEIVGPSIQGNLYKLKESELRIFTIYNLTHDRPFFNPNDSIQYRLPTWMMKLMLDQINESTEYNLFPELKTVPILNNELDDNICSKLGNNTITLDELLEYANGKSILNEQTNREGIVFVGHNKENDNDIISFKVISNNFLLKEK